MRISRTNWVEVGLVAALLVGTAWLGRQVHHNYVVHGATATSGLVTAPLALPASGLDGAKSPLALRDVDTPKMLYVLSTECQFCEQNMSEWRALSASLRGVGPDGPRPVVLSVSGADATREFLDRHGLDVDVRLIDKSVLPLLGVGGYPATLAVDPNSGAVASWSGVLREPDHGAILAWAGVHRGAASP
ncbi:MAG: hypothetical protein GKS06_10200 [Acidobacteria bacterium]|nr:hypothetical protein [Acidobacteriota bacterium]